jgi:hypothetical protein
MDQIKIDAYKQMLKKHDWYYAYSDDHSVFMRGQAAERTLIAQRHEVDPTGSIWNSVAPPEFQLKKLPCYLAQD